jgi:hypothetical protein
MDTPFCSKEREYNFIVLERRRLEKRHNLSNVKEVGFLAGLGPGLLKKLWRK